MTGEDPHAIPLAEAIALTRAWRAKYKGEFKAGRFDRIAFDKLLAKPGAEGIRIYMGLKQDGQWTYVMVATDAKGNDIFAATSPAMKATAGAGDDDCEEEAIPCPPGCDEGSPLNNDDPPPP